MSLSVNSNNPVNKLLDKNQNKINTSPFKAINNNFALSAEDSSQINKTGKKPFAGEDVNLLYNREIEKLSEPTAEVSTLPDFNVTPLRIGIAVEQKQASFYVPNGTLYFENEEGKKEIGTFENANFTVKNENNSLVIYKEDGKLLGIYKGKVSLDGNLSPVAINGKKYRGELEVIVNPKNPSTLNVINDVLLEDYLLGVVPSESPASWPLESLKAQAVAARTYAVGNWKRREELGFDLMSTTSDQMYTGLSAEQPSSTQAVKETTGDILTYQGKPINALFFSCSGGYTDSAMEVWNTDLPYIQPVQDYDQSAPKFKWTKTFENTDIQKALDKLGVDVGQIKSIEAIDFTEHKRVKTIKFTGTKGEATVDSNKFRLASGLNSTLWTVSTGSTKSLLKAAIPKTFTFNGGGWGHGLGMSQYGAKQMATDGKSYDEILKHYYTGVELNKIDTK